MKPVLSLQNVSKLYRIGSGLGYLRSLFPQRNIDMLANLNSSRYLWALKDVSFDVKPGEVLGIIGRNGAGKTTILKLISKVTRPTSGKVKTDGRISALIELGAGFHPELTGKENVYLNGIILGLNSKVIDERLENIVEFAGLEKFLDTPVKRYSSGMYARLAFAIAAHVDPNILLVDEVLAVGDQAFQLRCYDFIHAYVNSGRTAVFVSHNLYAIEQLCTRVIWLEKGKIANIGDPSEVLSVYMDEMDRDYLQLRPDKSESNQGIFKVRKFRMIDSMGQERNVFQAGENIGIQIEYECGDELERPYFVISISESRNTFALASANMLIDNFEVKSVNGKGTITCEFLEVPLKPRSYNIFLEVFGKDRSRIIFKWNILGGFRIQESGEIFSNNKPIRGQVRFWRTHAPVQLPYTWRC
jgi:lipopolysaccharide transport system ATP-binding protein